MKSWPRTDCPTCGARPGERCHTPTNGNSPIHKTRPGGPLGGITKPMTRQMATLDKPILREGKP